MRSESASTHVTAALRDFLDTDPYAEASGSGPRFRSAEPFTAQEHDRFAQNTAADV